ncbi:HTH domain-containing protein [Leucobacter edaphi]|uniref:HTH domain-containing protein n=1 Tax=Leucobacter edaphi TaxID=2796472 RepID=UPI0034E28E4B
MGTRTSVPHPKIFRRVPGDERIGGLVTLENVARLTGIDLETIESFLSDPRSVSDDKKYALGLRCGSLMLAVENASPYWRVAPPTWPDPGPQPGAPQMSPRNHS